jgi:hypothetical protein
LKRSNDSDEDSDSDDGHELFISNLSRKAMVEVKKAGATRVLRSGAPKRFPPTEMINAGNEQNGTYKRFDVDQKVATILNNFQVPAANRARRLYVYRDTCDINLLTKGISFTAFIKWEKLEYHAARKGSNTFWETGYVGEIDGFHTIPPKSMPDGRWPFGY